MKPVLLEGLEGIQARVYETDDIMKVIRVQVAIRRFLARRYRRMFGEDLQNRRNSVISPSPHVYGYQSPMVSAKMGTMKEFKWNDPFSASLLLQAGLTVFAKEEQLLDSVVRYTGEWSEAGLRHGKGSQVWPDGARYDGYFINDE
mmetsp:Transcript_34735/g.45694  ORF Transcript_34735/g.45694 Transcript_34735/m.45694 type:complete len:145 (+) Transcript_34735:102-536(+)|eukprot:CAMPEP_0185592634 /NCGR_PEP_ID=MMETSP0434-20130131/68571_1 /TAXON_ID=626734 ORGANISM="Favella taraikaensis, Strain Fe Narragansett Bay" /NCGR_SAMPLE_ID=MMETSP0434 /ASSEMBLY_ACC=CAM_ASM_000379 /LENGTH=144 /DNA_ID=CAMNT_0028218575 /DNA_START=29 /DNA_END=463 /DNA_ORIENTATION=+